ncbi:MAG: hypothetical protein II158_04805, partial [Bacilli bacterium]|nr:hypothetical protein [Bacilli bacterium]
MKNNKKLVVLAGAAALGLVAATGVTSGFAWFAVNNSVYATSLDVSAKTNASYLMINTTASTTGGDTTKAGKDPANTQVFPVSKATAEISWDHNTPDVTTDDKVISSGEWYTATVENRDNGLSAYTSLEKVSVGAANYFVHYDFYLYLAEYSEASISKKLTATANFGSSDASVKAAVTIDETNYYVVDRTNTSTNFNNVDVTFKVPTAPA